MAELIYGELKGAQKMLNVYDDHITLSQIKNIRTILTSDWFQGEKEILYCDISSVQYRPSSKLILGYLQFEVPGVRTGSNFGSENSWTFDSAMNEIAKEVCEYVKNRIREIKQPSAATVQAQNSVSPAEELLKLKELLDLGIITQDEFDSKKKQLLGL